MEQKPVVQGTPKGPDYRIEGEIFDCAAPSSDNPYSIMSNLNKSKIQSGQTQRLVIYLDDTPVTPAQIQKAITEYPIPKLKEIIFIKDGDIVVP